MIDLKDSRQTILNQMQTLWQQNVSCQKCVGHCCTSKSNSMQITKAEAHDIYQHLKKEGLINQDLIDKLNETIELYRLEVEMPALGKKINFRRTYTCSFYTPGATGCSLPFAVKPLGCLAFNPIEEKSYELLNCLSDQKLLEIVSEKNSPKLPIPLAVLAEIKQHNVNE